MISILVPISGVQITMVAFGLREGYFMILMTSKHVVCGKSMQLFQVVAESKPSDPVKAGVFLKGTTRLVIRDDLQLMHPTSSSNFSLFSHLGVMDATASALEIREFDIEQDKVINLLKNSLISKEAFSQTLLKKNESHQAHLFGGSSCSRSSSRNFQIREAENGRIGWS
ncbi:hypothetical protein M5689_002622 [Euphorbia peplus]|nr:hypothetical protein M5689_002622 [Euphorbia peplus]